MTNDSNFDKSRYIKILTKEDSLKKNEGTSLFDENRAERRELLSYRIRLESQIYYNRKEEYLFLMEEYLRENAGEDGAIVFRLQFLHIYRKDNKALKTLEEEILEKGLQVFSTFLLDSKSEGFSKLIEQIVSDCDFLTFNPEETYGFNEDQFRDSIEEIFFQMQKYSDEEMIKLQLEL